MFKALGLWAGFWENIKHMNESLGLRASLCSYNAGVNARDGSFDCSVENARS